MEIPCCFICILLYINLGIMKTLLSVSLLILLTSNNIHAQQPYAWARSSSGSGDESARNITVDKQGNIYHTGVFSGTADFDPGAGIANLTSNGMDDIYLARYDSAGHYLWAISIGGAQYDWASMALIDDTGNVYVTGLFGGTVDFDPGPGTDFFTSGFADIFIAKYDSAGNYLWAKQMVGNGGAFPPLMASDKAGNIFLAGMLFNNIDFDPGFGNASLFSTGGNLYFAKYDNNGNYIRAYKIGNNPNQGIDIAGLALDSLANIYIAGAFSSSGPFDFDPGAGIANLYTAGLNSNDIYFAKYDSAGNYLWAYSLPDTSTHDEYCTGLYVNGAGDIFICGVLGYINGTADSVYSDFDPGAGVAGFPGKPGAFFARYDSAGNYIYAKALYSSNTNPQPMALATDPAGNVYLTGTFLDTVDFNPGTAVTNLVGNNTNIFYAKYDPNGQLDFAYGIGGFNNCTANAIALDSFDNAYIAGSFMGTVDFDPGAGVSNLTALLGQDMVIVKFGDSTAPVKVMQVSTNSDISIYPNPARESVTVRSSSKINEVRLTNTMGQLLQTSQADKISLGDYPPGVYFIHVSTADGSFTRKFLKE